jgi:hypothetical protein
MNGRNSRLLLALACALSGFLAGETIDKFIVELPAWPYLGINAWAEYSRHADLGNGIFIYPIEAIGSFALLFTFSIVLLKKDRADTRRISSAAYLATLFSLLGVIFTFFAAPHIIGIREVTDPAILQHSFDQFYYWSTFRGVAQVLSFLGCVWTLANWSIKP